MCRSMVIGPASGGFGRGVPGGDAVGYTTSRARAGTNPRYDLKLQGATPSIADAILSVAPPKEMSYGQATVDRRSREATQGHRRRGSLFDGERRAQRRPDRRRAPSLPARRSRALEGNQAGPCEECPTRTSYT